MPTSVRKTACELLAIGSAQSSMGMHDLVDRRRHLSLEYFLARLFRARYPQSLFLPRVDEVLRALPARLPGGEPPGRLPGGEPPP